ncbi:helix-turn-helix domain-containing protein [Macrococcus brunensis]|uniref:helix-turn-helix domain-containing protein n=1 Tax=Macrococcus brunensis TaxID=198483 RepID=UPI001EEFEC60|nr:transcriptional regulator [Macrococcus brunensis]ULG72973.1 transcriptional regulator [Macrococcus brunensis]
MEAKEFGKYLKKLRLENGYTIRQVEMKTEISNAYLSQIENGKRGVPSAAILKKLAPVYKVGYTELFQAAGYIDEDEPELIEADDPETLMFKVEGLKDLPEEEIQRIEQTLIEQALFMIERSKKK